MLPTFSVREISDIGFSDDNPRNDLENTESITAGEMCPI